MIPPIQCFSCGKIIANDVYFKIREILSKSPPPDTVEMSYSLKSEFEKLGIHRYCCRMAIISSIDVSDFIQKK